MSLVRTWWYVLFFAAALGVSAQERPCILVLSGTVIDDHDRAPLAYAEVFLPDLLKGAVANERGEFRVEGLCAGIHRVRVTHLGCEPVERRVELDKDVSMQFRLEHHSEELRELEVVGSRPDENVGMARTELDRRAMQERAGLGIAEMVVGIPGVTMLSSGPTIAKPMIHGLYGNRVLMLNQGIRQEDQQWGSEHAPALDPFTSDRITVVKGAASVQYGADAIGGVVINEPVELPRSAGIRGGLGLLGRSNGRGGGAGALLEGGVGGVSGLGWRVQGSWQRLGDAAASNYQLSNTGLREAGLSASVGYQRHRAGASVYYSWLGRELGILRASHIGNLTDLSNAIASGTPWYVAPFTYDIGAPRQLVQHHLFKAEGYLRLSDRDRIVATYGYQANDRQEFDVRRGGRSDRPALDMFLTTHSADVVLKHWIGRKLHGKAGLAGSFQENANIPGTGVRPLLPDYEKRTGGLFAVEHLPLGDRVELEGGVRVEGTVIGVERYDAAGIWQRPQHEFVNQAFSFGANWAVRDSVVLRANIGSAYRPPHVSELYSEGLHHGAAAIEEGDPALGSERALRSSVDLDGQWMDGRLRVLATVHASRFDGYIYLRPSGYRLTIRGAFPVFTYVATDADLYGFDATASYAFSIPFSFTTRWSSVRGWDRELQEWLFQMPSDRMENTLTYRRHRWGALHDLEWGITSTVVLEQSRFPMGLDFTAPPAAYHLLGSTLSMSLPLGSHALQFGVRAANLLNVAYRDYLDRFRYYADARGIDIAIWLRYEFGRPRGSNVQEENTP